MSEHAKESLFTKIARLTVKAVGMILVFGTIIFFIWRAFFSTIRPAEVRHISANGTLREAYEAALAEGKIVLMGKETDEAFLANVMEQVNDKAVVEKVADDFKMVFTPFHGTGYELIPEALKRLGMKHVICVPEQMVIDGDFPTVKSPNPENPEGFYLAIGAQGGRSVGVPGEDAQGVQVGVTFLTEVNQDESIRLAGRTVVIGGGNVGMSAKEHRSSRIHIIHHSTFFTGCFSVKIHHNKIALIFQGINLLLASINLLTNTDKLNRNSKFFSYRNNNTSLGSSVKFSKNYSRKVRNLAEINSL